MGEIGKVVGVTVSTENNAAYVDVGISPNRELSKIKFRQPSGGLWIIPNVGDMVEVAEIGNGEKAAFGKHNNTEATMPDGLDSGDIAIEVGDGTVLQFDADSGDVTLTCEGDLNLDAANIYVGDSENAETVATGSHTHNDSSGGTTGQPSDVTAHKME